MVLTDDIPPWPQASLELYTLWIGSDLIQWEASVVASYQERRIAKQFIVPMMVFRDGVATIRGEFTFQASTTKIMQP